MSGILNIGNIQANTAGAAATFVPITATGGFPNQVVAANGVQYICHVFNQSGTWTVSNAGSSGEVEYLIVGGGGGGGMDMGGGGGGGGAIYGKTTVSAGSYSVTVGAGGWGAPGGGQGRGDGGGIQPTQHQFTIPGTVGGNSSLFGITAYGGGYGGSSYYPYTPGAAGTNGGCGGGASGYSNGGTTTGGTGVSGQGYAGGQGGGQYYSGGGGGAGTPGTPSTLQSSGGAGLFCDILGYGYYWGGGGGGSGYSIWGGSGGQGGGGGGAVGTTYGGRGFNNGAAGGGGDTSSQTNKPGGNGGLNTGGGGGGGSHYNSNNSGGRGGSGIVVIRYPLTPVTEQLVTCTNGGVVAVPGTILQTVFVRTDRQFIYNAPSYNNGGNTGGTPIGELALTITPKSANSLLLVRWMINGEMQHDTVFTVNRDGALVKTSGYEGYNTQAGGVPWAGIVTGKYDRNDVNSTSQNWFLQYWMPAGATNITTFYPTVRSSTYGSNQTFYLNRCAGSAGQDSYEASVSTGYIMEIAQ